MSGRERIKSAFPCFDEESVKKILLDIEIALKSGILTSGPHVEGFESKFANYLNSRHAIAVNSGTSNLEIALRYFGVKDKEVIVPTNTFVATPNSVIFAGGRPVFADICEDTLCIDPADAKKKVTDKTVGIVVVHIAGLVCPQIFELSKFCKDNGLFLIEDSAHAHGAMIDNYKAGTLGDAGCFSFYPTKVMTTGEGGMLVTNNSALAEAARVMRNHGQTPTHLMVTLGYNWRMSEIAAIIGEYQLAKLEFFIKVRNEIARIYETTLKNVDAVSLFKTPSNIRHSYYKFPLKLDDDIEASTIASVLKNEYNIETGNLYYPPCHMHPYYLKRFGKVVGDLPVAERVLDKILCLPIHPGITEEQAFFIVDALSRSINN